MSQDELRFSWNESLYILKALLEELEKINKNLEELKKDFERVHIMDLCGPKLY